MLEFNVAVRFPIAPLLTVILALVGEYWTMVVEGGNYSLVRITMTDIIFPAELLFALLAYNKLLIISLVFPRHTHRPVRHEKR